MKKSFLSLFLWILFSAPGFSQQEIILAKEKLQDKIKGGWAGQTIGVTFGGPYEFAYQGTFINDYVTLQWDSTLIADRLKNSPGLYDDLYMDLTFVEVMEKYGLEAPLDSFASAFAHAGYMLWHANQAARYNILNGVKAPLSGYWKNNPHADCIDYQIESDFAGLMSPAMPNTASSISDKIGHIMNYGDGWYGGVYVGAMYTLAFVSDDINYIVKEALKTIPAQSSFYQCIQDVIKWHDQYPEDWKRTWFEIQRKWADDVGCPDGVFSQFNIDAKVNAAYVVTGLLYGQGDFTKTLDIATRCGQDADCNPSTAGGILGAVMGYNHIPLDWRKALTGAENIKFKYTSMSLNDIYRVSYKHALENILMNGGREEGENIIIKLQLPAAVRFEQNFTGMKPESKIPVNDSKTGKLEFTFKGTGFVIRGEAVNPGKKNNVLLAELYVDDMPAEEIKLPVSFTTRRTELAWKYDLMNMEHRVQIKLKNPGADDRLVLWDYIIYSTEDHAVN